MRKLTILLLCCGVLVSMIGCGGNTASPPADDSPPTMVSETVTKETPIETIPLTTAVEPTEKEESVPTESKEQVIEDTVATPITTKKPTDEINNSETTNTSEENDTTQTIETTSSIDSQHTESEMAVTKPTQETAAEPESTTTEFDVEYWIMFAKKYAVSIGLKLDSTAVDCWDNPIRAGTHCIYLERDIKIRLNRYAKDEDITDVWIWAEPVGNDCYDIYIGYA